MSKLRCWPHCLARLHDSDLPQNIGAIVECVRVDEAVSAIYGEPMWECISLRALQSVTGPGRSTGGFAHDSCLTPITPPPGTDMTDIHAEREDELVGLV